jgi:murein DD-endopeptidase MepM/ murein hydrolase activator NlpD
MKRILIIIIISCFYQQIYAQKLKRSKTIENDSVFVDFINPFHAPVELKLTALDSTKSFIRINPYGVLQQGDTLKNALVLPLHKVKDTAQIDSKNYISLKGTFGDPKSDIDLNYRYTLPFPRGKKYKIIQSFGGKFSHNKPYSRYALDIGTQIGDTITAARSGVVMFIKQDSDEHCRTIKCVDKGNKIIILHNDGSMAHYVHLDFEGALVEIGDKVEVNEPIAISGMTGFTTIPHLHFVVFKAGGISIPFKFIGQKSQKLKQGRYYLRRH